MENDFYNELLKIIPKLQGIFMKTAKGPLAKGQISMPQMALLQVLFERKSVKMSELAKSMGVTMGAVTGLADRMIRSNYIKRARGLEDRRIVIVELTKKGYDTIEKLTKEKMTVVKKAFSCLTKNEQKTYLQLVQKVYNGMIKSG